MGIVRDEEHSDGAPTIEWTGIRVQDVADAYEHSDYEPDEITQLYPDLSLSDVHRAPAYYYDHIDDFRSTSAESASARRGRCIATRASESPSPTDFADVAGRSTLREAKERWVIPTASSCGTLSTTSGFSCRSTTVSSRSSRGASDQRVRTIKGRSR
jgi:uncharacterized protein (DUF433 family)